MDPIANNNMNDDLNNDKNDETSETQALLTAYALGELEGEDLAKAEALIASDPAAKAEVEEIRKMATQLEEALAAEGAGATAGLKPEQVEAIHARAQKEPETQEAVVARLVRPWVWWTAGSAAAAMFAVALLMPSLGAARRSANFMQTSPDVAMVDRPSASPSDDKLRDDLNRIGRRTPDAGAAGNALGANARSQSGKVSGEREELSTRTEQAYADVAEGKNKDLADKLNTQTPSSPAPKETQQRLADGSTTQFTSRGTSKVDARTRQSHETLAMKSENARVGARTHTAPMSIVAEVDRVDRDNLAGRFNPNFHTEAYDTITDNPFLKVGQNPLSTFSIDVDTASYANIRRMLMQQSQLPPAGAVRIEEMVNYFPYEYSNPAGDERPFGVHVETGSAPWAHEHRLVKIGIKGKDIVQENKPVTNIVFLIDVSGSMMQANKLPLLKEGMKLLVKQMDEKDHVAIAVYAGAAGMVLDSTSGKDQDTILAAIDNLQGGGSTNGGAGIRLAYDLAQKNFVKEGVNRVILASDGDFNVGTTSQDELVKLIEEKRKSGVFLSVLGFGNGNYKDSTMEKIANKGNGNYAYIDTLKEAQKVLVEQGAGTLYTIAKDVKIQVEFNPAKVQAYRLIGYENRLLAKEDFNDDTKDAGEIGAGHTVTALYEVVPVGVKAPGVPPVDELKYQTTKPAEKPAAADERTDRQLPAEISNELLTVKLRYKQPDGDVSTKMDVPVIDAGKTWHDASQDYRFAAGVAQFGMMLRNSPYKADSSYAQVLDLAQSGLGKDEKGYRSEFIKLVEKARELSAVRDAKSE